MWPISKIKIRTSQDLQHLVQKVTSLEDSHSHIVLEIYKGMSRTGTDMLGSMVVSPTNIKHLMNESHDRYLQGISVIDSFLTKSLLENDRNLTVNVCQGSFNARMFTEDKVYNKKIEDLLDGIGTKYEAHYMNGTIDEISFPDEKTYDGSKKIANKISSLIADKTGVSCVPIYAHGKWGVRIYNEVTEELSTYYSEHSY